MKKIYDILKDEFIKYNVVLGLYQQNKLPSYETNLLLVIDSIKPLALHFSQYEVQGQFIFTSNRELDYYFDILNSVITSFIPVEERLTDDNLPDNTDKMVILDTIEYESISNDIDGKNADSVYTVDFIIRIEI